MFGFGFFSLLGIYCTSFASGIIAASVSGIIGIGGIFDVSGIICVSAIFSVIVSVIFLMSF